MVVSNSNNAPRLDGGEGQDSQDNPLGGLAGILNMLGLGGLVDLLSNFLGGSTASNQSQNADSNDAPSAGGPAQRSQNSTPAAGAGMPGMEPVMLTAPDGNQTATIVQPQSGKTAYGFDPGDGRGAVGIMVGSAREESIGGKLLLRRGMASDGSHQTILDEKANTYAIPTDGKNDQVVVDKINDAFDPVNRKAATLSTDPKSPGVVLNLSLVPVETSDIAAHHVQRSIVGHVYGDLLAYGDPSTLGGPVSSRDKKDHVAEQTIAKDLKLLPGTVMYEGPNAETKTPVGTLTITAKDSDSAFRAYEAMTKSMGGNKQIGDQYSPYRVQIPVGNTIQIFANFPHDQEMVKKMVDSTRGELQSGGVAPAHNQAPAPSAEEVKKIALEKARKEAVKVADNNKLAYVDVQHPHHGGHKPHVGVAVVQPPLNPHRGH